MARWQSILTPPPALQSMCNKQARAEAGPGCGTRWYPVGGRRSSEGHHLSCHWGHSSHLDSWLCWGQFHWEGECSLGTGSPWKWRWGPIDASVSVCCGQRHHSKRWGARIVGDPSSQNRESCYGFLFPPWSRISHTWNHHKVHFHAHCLKHS